MCHPPALIVSCVVCVMTSCHVSCPQIMCKRDPAAEAIKRDEALAAMGGREGVPVRASPATPPDAPDGDGATATTTPAPDATPMDDGDENNE